LFAPYCEFLFQLAYLQYCSAKQTYRGHCQEHDYQLLLVEDRMPYERIRETRKTFSSLLEESSICSYWIAVD
jgi:hypothetical protein